MSQLTITLPDSISETQARLSLAIKLFEMGRLSCGKAAELSGYSKRTFLELLGKAGVPVVDYPVEELAEELHNAKLSDDLER